MNATPGLSEPLVCRPSGGRTGSHHCNFYMIGKCFDAVCRSLLGNFLAAALVKDYNHI